MRRALPAALTAICVLAAPTASTADPPRAAKPTLESYFAREEPGMKAAGVRRIPITTPKGSCLQADQADWGPAMR